MLIQLLLILHPAPSIKAVGEQANNVKIRVSIGSDPKQKTHKEKELHTVISNMKRNLKKTIRKTDKLMAKKLKKTVIFKDSWRT